MLERRVDLAYDCLRSAQLYYVEASQNHATGCMDLDFPDIDQRWEEIVGNPQPAPWIGSQADDGWAEQEAVRIARWKTKSVWLFLPVYNENAINGFPKQRRLLEKLDLHLQVHGCRLSKTTSRGNSSAEQFDCKASDE